MEDEFPIEWFETDSIDEDWIVGEDDIKTEWNIGTGYDVEIENVKKNDENSDDAETSSTVSQRMRSFISEYLTKSNFKISLPIFNFVHSLITKY